MAWATPPGTGPSRHKVDPRELCRRHAGELVDDPSPAFHRQLDARLDLATEHRFRGAVGVQELQ